MKRLFAALLAAVTLLSSTGCGKKAEEPIPPPPPPAEETPADPTPPPVAEILPEPEDPLDLLLKSMTTEEKVGQLFFVRCPAENAVEDVETYHLGGYLLFGRDFKDKLANDIIQTIQSYQDAAKLPLLIGVDEEGGTVVRVSSNPHLRAKRFPAPRTFRNGDAYDFAALTQNTREKDLLLRALGVNVNFAPVADMADPGAFIYDRTFGLDRDQTAEAARTMVEQMRSDGVGSVLKHFPGYGNNADTHTGIALDDRPVETFTAENELAPFLAHQASGGTSAVLVSHNIIQALDPDRPASLSPAAYDLLRREAGFDGVALTDDLAMEAVSAYARDGAVALMALQAGCDMVVTTDYRTQIPKVVEAVETGAFSEEALDAACRRVLLWKQSLGLL